MSGLPGPLASGTTPTITKPHFWYKAQHKHNDQTVSHIQYKPLHNRIKRVVTFSGDVPIEKVP
jgi:hypothetical protein